MNTVPRTSVTAASTALLAKLLVRNLVNLQQVSIVNTYRSDCTQDKQKAHVGIVAPSWTQSCPVAVHSGR
jgi:hypothetical protein